MLVGYKAEELLYIKWCQSLEKIYTKKNEFKFINFITYIIIKKCSTLS
jgi:hypothetical protein